MAKTKLTAMLLVALCAILTAYAHVLWKFVVHKDIIGMLSSWQLWAGFFLLGFGAAILITSFKYGDVSVLYPIIATSYIWVIILSWYYFSEPINTYKLISVAGIVLGITILGKGSKEAEKK